MTDIIDKFRDGQKILHRSTPKRRKFNDIDHKNYV